MWHWLSDPTNQKTLAFIGGGVGAIVGAAWAVFKFLCESRAKKPSVTESFSKAAEQLASEKIEARLGGIYALERISRESPDDYWIVMETLTAFLQEHTRSLVNLYDDEKSKDTQQPEPTADIAAVLTVIVRRDVKNLKREKLKGWRLNFRGSDLRGASLAKAHLEGANLEGAYLEGANLKGAHLEGANLEGARLEGANLEGARLEATNLEGAHLTEGNLMEAHLEKANLGGAYLEGANLWRAHLEGAIFIGFVRVANFEGASLMEHISKRPASRERISLGPDSRGRI